MPKPVTADDLLPLVASLAPQERVRFMRLVAEQGDIDEGAVYAAVPEQRHEFSTDEESLAWDSEGWETEE